jgi:CRP-like cAMP-binding protein
VDQLSPRGENRLLLSLSSNELTQLKPRLKELTLELGTVLHRPGEPIDYVYFPTSGLVSLLAVMQTGEAIETGIVGREGLVGGAVALDGAQSFAQAMVQIEGSALRIGTAHFLKLLEENDDFRNLLNRYQSVLMLQAQQSAACHAFHSIEARLCRWLLHSADTVESNMVYLTQEFLSHMLGCQRTSVTMAAHALQRSGLIRYTRGRIEILDRSALAECACECYGVLRREIDAAVPVLH